MEEYLKERGEQLNRVGKLMGEALGVIKDTAEIVNEHGNKLLEIDNEMQGA
jgi:hypothetical protein